MFKKIGWLFFANSFAQVVQLLTQPVLTRYFGPAEFNLIGQITSLATVFVIVGNLQLHNCLAVSRNEEEREDILNAGLGWLTCLSLVVILIAVVVSQFITKSNFETKQAIYLGLMIWILGTGNLIFGYFSGASNFRQAGYFSIKRAVFVSGAQFILALKPIGNGLILGVVLGEFAVRATTLNVVKKINFNSWLKKLRISVKKYRDYTFFGTFQESVSVLVLMLPLYSFGFLFGDQIGGNYAFAYRMVWAPGMLLAASISPILLRHLSSIEKSILLRVNSQIILQAALIFLVSICVFHYVLIPAVDWWLDARWDIAMEMMASLALWVSAYLAALKVRQLYRVYRLQKWQLVIDIFIVTAMAIAFFILKLDSKKLILVSSLIGVAQNFTIIFVYIIFSKSIRRHEVGQV